MKNTIIIILLFALIGCKSDDDTNQVQNTILDIEIVDDDPNNIRILALGDSYTSGHNVCDTCGFPEQLTDSLMQKLNSNFTYDLNVIADLGFTTENLLTVIDWYDLDNNHDLVTLLIGVNNQYQNINFYSFFQEFPELVNKAIIFGKNDPKNVIVLSIPDYAYSPFGQSLPNPAIISQEIDFYNEYIKHYCNEYGITFINITDISRLGLRHPELITFDTLNFSEEAFTRIVNRILPIALDKLNR